MAVTRPELTGEQIRDVNVRYHDAAAESYDSKWAIDYGEVGVDQVLMKLRKALGRQPERFERALEVGAGTGYFTLNLLRANVIGRATATDISGGMLKRLAATAADLALEVETAEADAEDLPFGDESFDLVFGHAVLHHIPDLPRALAEFRRALAPGGTLVFMGEPSEHGDSLAAVPKQVGRLAGPVWRRVVRARAQGSDPRSQISDLRGQVTEVSELSDLERFVDVHTFSPGELRGLAEGAGFEGVRVTGEELLANAYGWLLRSMEGTADPDTVPITWHRFAFRSYLALQNVDARVLEPRLPASLFYNLLISARKPAAT